MIESVLWFFLLIQVIGDLFGGNKIKSEQQKWRELVGMCVLLICLTTLHITK